MKELVLVKVLQSCHFNVFRINHRCLRKMPIEKNNEQPRLLKRFLSLQLTIQSKFINLCFISKRLIHVI